jgi:hypothetical protein
VKIGDAVVFTRYEQGSFVSYPANLLSLPDAEGRVQLYFYHPDRSRHLGGADWRDAIDRAVSVLPKDKAGDFIPYYDFPASGLPSADDLDADAAEKKAAEATAEKSGKVRQIKGK